MNAGLINRLKRLERRRLAGLKPIIIWFWTLDLDKEMAEVAFARGADDWQLHRNPGEPEDDFFQRVSNEAPRTSPPYGSVNLCDESGYVMAVLLRL